MSFIYYYYHNKLILNFQNNEIFKFKSLIKEKCKLKSSKQKMDKNNRKNFTSKTIRCSSRWVIKISFTISYKNLM